jgi:hypothetical protein
MPYDIFLPAKELKKAENGQKVIVTIAKRYNQSVD